MIPNVVWEVDGKLITIIAHMVLQAVAETNQLFVSSILYYVN